MNKAIDPALMQAAEAVGSQGNAGPLPSSLDPLAGPDAQRQVWGHSESLPRMDAYWMPFTANRQFKQAPRLLAKAALKPVERRKRPRNSVTVATMGAINQTKLPVKSAL